MMSNSSLGESEQAMYKKALEDSSEYGFGEDKGVSASKKKKKRKARTDL